MNVLDVLLVLAAVWFAVIGYRQGFIVGVLSVVGFLGGGLVAVLLLPPLWRELGGDVSPGTLGAVAAVVLVIVCASVGQALTTQVGNRLRVYVTWSPARAVDATGGALANVLAMLLVAWLIGSALATTSLPTVGREVRNSSVLQGVSRALPANADTWFTGFSSVLAQNGFPQVFSPFANEPITAVPEPDPRLAGSEMVAVARRSIVKVTGTAVSCGKSLEGTGFVFAEGRVMTNAHVVGGVREPTVQVGGVGRLYDADVVLYDWERDVAVLDVPGLDAPALEFEEGAATTGDDAVIAGFPENGGFDARSARVRGRVQANGPDIYHRGSVRRDVYSLFTTVRQGNSGGPLLTPDGKVYGVVFAKSLEDPQTGYALTYDEVRETVTRGRSSLKPVNSQGCAL
ncbi:MarP family serine protease [Streptomyces alkaliterrae]|uniref:MarP family serine protease n=1 Tax=Streptomyces alkaliterrae TaxID=2213162 RepID=A0A5P0YP34_9ACTN|nr:MarP family serine protease [Streptomyces alkaliterrae]MBB1251871.1 MarP family serine protease [Streptomyces alkaliterrae]MBB1261367.1 MarP family serine protease [Streptomyces alkaliterrae]MQS00289.1 MarP family serine protease [Streptomyces alkaliterrae]